MLALVQTATDVRLAAGVLLVLYAATLAVLTPRELRFLSGVEPAWRWRFLLQDLLIQAGVLLVLLPAALLAELSLAGFILLGVGFMLMWGAALWAAVARYVYIYRILLNAHREPPQAPADKQKDSPGGR